MASATTSLILDQDPSAVIYNLPSIFVCLHFCLARLFLKTRKLFHTHHTESHTAQQHEAVRTGIHDIAVHDASAAAAAAAVALRVVNSDLQAIREKLSNTVTAVRPW